MKFSIRFRIGNRLGAASRYSLRDFCLSVIDRYSLTEHEICTIVTLQVGEVFVTEDLQVQRVA